MKKIIGLIKELYSNSVMRYIFWGGCTTLVNLVNFYILRKLGVQLTIANIISIILAILFAYVVNSRFVFRDRRNGFFEHIQPFLKFVSARLFSMVVEVGGVWVLVEKILLPDMVGKLATQIIVLVLNYIFSKFFVFTKSESGE
jgi:putative flippase GtrA